MEIQIIKDKIYQIRGQRIMLDFDLAALYETETRILKQAVRNIERFPEDFMFQLSKTELNELITNCDNLPETLKFSPSTPFAFTEQGVAMLSSVINNKKAIEVNITIIRAFVMLRQYLSDFKELKEKIEGIEKEMKKNSRTFIKPLLFYWKKTIKIKPKKIVTKLVINSITLFERLKIMTNQNLNIKKSILVTFLLIYTGFLSAQEDIYPVYKGCDASSETTLASCFNQNLTKDVLSEFKVPENVNRDNYKGTVNVIFVVTKTGEFEVLYVRSSYKELELEAKRVFALLPIIKPATYNGRPIDMRFGLPIQIPLGSQQTPAKISKENIEENVVTTVTPPMQPSEPTTNIQKTEIQSAVVSTFFPEHHSELNIPFTHSTYDELGFYYDQNENSHTGFKPYLYSETSKYVDLDAQKTGFFKDKSSKLGKKLWNEHFFKVQKEDYWFTIDPLFDLQIGKDNSKDVDYTFNNTRAVQIQGGLGKNFNFSASIYESQGRFADYINDFARANRPSGASSYGLVPGRGKAKDFKTNSFDYPAAEAYLTYTPSKFFNFQFGHGKNFVGDGYRSLMLSDAATSYPHFKISTQFWKIKYTNVWMWLEDVRPSANINGLSARKFVAMHHLSWNVTEKFNVSLFEAAITKKDENNGFDINYFNPIIFYRAVEFSRGSDAGNAIIGLGTKYKVSDNFSTYTQVVLDELTVGKIFDGSGYWANKFGVQVGAKYYNAFKVDNLYLQAEFNVVRPYTFSHKETVLNYAHYNQPLGHLWGSNFWELVTIARYKKDRWFGSAKINYGNKGFDINGLNYGGNIYESYDNRVGDSGIELLQGNNTRIFIADLQGGYLINPATNTKLFAGFTYRKLNPAQAITDTGSEATTWFTIGLKADLFNWYFDF